MEEENKTTLWGKKLGETTAQTEDETKKIIREMRENIMSMKNCEYLINNRFLLIYSYNTFLHDIPPPTKEEALDIYDLENKTLLTILVKRRFGEGVRRDMTYISNRTSYPHPRTKHVNIGNVYVLFDIYLLNFKQDSFTLSDLVNDKNALAFLIGSTVLKDYVQATLKKLKGEYDDIKTFENKSRY